MIKKLLSIAGIALLVLVAILLVNTFTLKSKQKPSEGTKVAVPSIDDAALRLAKSITFKTVSYDDTAMIDYSQFLAFHEFLKSSFPTVFSQMTLDVVSNYTLFLQWKGKDSTLPPAIFMAHQDVVPVSEDTKDLWSVPAFDGLIKDGILYGRGVIDDKINLMAQLETAEYLLKKGFTPKRSIYFVFGHDEEIGGDQGALKVAEILKNRGIKAAFVLDEGGLITNDKIPGIDKPVALIGTSEKGGVTLELSVNIPGGHSSFPGKATAIDVLAKALVDLRSHPFSPNIAPSIADFIEYTAPEMPFHQKLVMGNSWLFKPLIYNIYSQTPMGDATIRTTMVPTIIDAGVKSNVVPTIATAKVNYRTLQGTSVKDVIEHTKKAINNEQIKIAVMPVPREATFTSSADSMGFQEMMSPLKHHFEGAIVSPFLIIGGTDSRHFKDVTPNIYRFSPMIDPIGFHGVDEQLKISDYSKSIGFYHEFILKL